MTMLRFKDLSQLKTKRIEFDDGYNVENVRVMLLQRLTAMRTPIEEPVNQTSSNTEAVAREESGGSSCRRQQELEEYLPYLETLVHHIDSARVKVGINKWVSKLKIQWSSILNPSCVMKMNLKPKLYQINSLHYEYGMTLFLYAATLRQSALEAPTNDFAQSVTFLRKAAGVFEYLATQILPLIQPLPQSKPAEVIPCVSTALSLVCLAEAQAVSIMRAQQRGTTKILLAKLSFGVVGLLDQASVVLQKGCKVSKDVTSQFPEFVLCSKLLHELRGYKYFAETIKEAGGFGNAIGLLNLALYKAKKEGLVNSAWKSVIKKEMIDVDDTRKKYEHENDFLTQEKLPLEHKLPLPECKRIVEPIAYQPKKVQLQKDLCFRVVT